jgi:CubicO group peptidase (beta-lactamase class C family)
MKPIFLRAALTLATLASPLDAAPPVIDRVSVQMDEHIQARQVAGVVTLVADEKEILHLSANGLSNVEKSTSMSADTVFWIASMTKPVTGAAVMILQDEGRLSVKDPVSKYLPEFKELQDKDGNPVTVTLEQCLAHTCGLSELSPDEIRNSETLAQLTPLITAKPVQFLPNEKWAYCQTGINMAARVVEVVSGLSFPEFLEKRLFGPLGMTDTTFYPDHSQSARISTPYRLTPDGGLEAADFSFLHGKQATDPKRVPMANGGLFSTAPDYVKFAQMVLRGGELNGKRILSEASVRQMTSVTTGDLTTGFTPGNGWGLGWCVIREPQGPSASLSSGSFGHGGLYGTQAWIDPVKKRIYLLMIQRADMKNSDASDIRRDFQDAAAPTS